MRFLTKIFVMLIFVMVLFTVNSFESEAARNSDSCSNGEWVDNDKCCGSNVCNICRYEYRGNNIVGRYTKIHCDEGCVNNNCRDAVRSSGGGSNGGNNDGGGSNQQQQQQRSSGEGGSSTDSTYTGKNFVNNKGKTQGARYSSSELNDGTERGKSYCDSIRHGAIPAGKTRFFHVACGDGNGCMEGENWVNFPDNGQLDRACRAHNINPGGRHGGVGCGNIERSCDVPYRNAKPAVPKVLEGSSISTVCDAIVKGTAGVPVDKRYFFHVGDIPDGEEGNKCREGSNFINFPDNFAASKACSAYKATVTQDLSKPVGEKQLECDVCEGTKAPGWCQGKVSRDIYDLNKDGKVDFNDLLIVIEKQIDYNNDGRVNQADIDWFADKGGYGGTLKVSADQCMVNFGNKNARVDVNGDGIVNLVDFSHFQTCSNKNKEDSSGSVKCEVFDFDNDGKIDGDNDFSCFNLFFGTSLSNFACIDNTQCLGSDVCSKGRLGKEKVGHCCPDGQYWDDTKRDPNKCTETADVGEECGRCPYLQDESNGKFYLSISGGGKQYVSSARYVLDPSCWEVKTDNQGELQRLACSFVDRFSKNKEKRTVEVISY
jgi:hypothetical protein